MEKVAVRDVWWQEYGTNVDPYELPSKIRESHLAIIRGRQKKQEKENDKAKREANKAKR